MKVTGCPLLARASGWLVKQQEQIRLWRIPDQCLGWTGVDLAHHRQTDRKEGRKWRE